MERLNMQTANLADDKYRKLVELFPNAVTETIDENGEVVRCIDKDVLAQEINTHVVEGREERYQFTWPDKRKAIIAANAPSNCTLRPCREESVDFDTTQNLYIEGDNLEVLKLLQENYLGKVKMIYIDPPYNTGNDFVYEDDLTESTKDFKPRSFVYDEDGNQVVSAEDKNTLTNGRFHTDWLNMMYPRLTLARNLLTDDGVIFISIDDNEVENLRKICDEVFGEENFIETLKWKKKKQPSFLAKHTAKVMEYILVYAKNENCLEKLSIEGTSDSTKKVINVSNPESIRVFKPGVRVKGEPRYISAGAYTIKTMTVEFLSDVNVENGVTTNEVEVRARFSVSQEKINSYINENLLFITAQNGLRRDVSDEEIGKKKSITDLLLSEWGDNQESDKEFLELFPNKYFEFVKPTKLLSNLVKCNDNENSIILDFFSGSATTAHAVMQLNAEDGGNRRFIMVQLPEETAEDSEARKAGYHNICEIGKERIRRAGKKIKADSPLTTQDLDTGFRVLKLDSSNMQEVYYTPETFVAKNLWEQTIDNIKEDRTAEDLLFQVMLELDVPLSEKIERTEVDGHEVWHVEGNYLVVCFDANLTEETITAIAKQKPYYFVMRDASMADDSVAVNFDQIFKSYSPDTTLKVL